MLQITKESADRAATQYAEAARDMNLAAKDLLDAVEAVGGLARVLVLLEAAAPCYGEPLGQEELARLARRLREHGHARAIPPALTGVEIGAETDSPALGQSVAEIYLRHGVLWQVPDYPKAAWLTSAAAHLNAGQRIRVLAREVSATLT